MTCRITSRPAPAVGDPPDRRTSARYRAADNLAYLEWWEAGRPHRTTARVEAGPAHKFHKSLQIKSLRFSVRPPTYRKLFVRNHLQQVSAGPAGGGDQPRGASIACERTPPPG